jgi:peptidoglycan/LPS O-acetylase OafA/YrhL
MGGRRAAWSVVLGVISVVTLPAAIVATRYSSSYDLLHAGFAIPLAALTGIGALALARKARALDRATLGQSESGKAATWGRVLGIVGLCIAASATIAVAVYGVLTAAD